MQIIINSFLITVGVGLGVLALTVVAFIGQVGALALLERLERNRR